MWSYSGDPGTSEIDAVRFYVQDTDTNRQLLSNEEISFLIASQQDSYDDPLIAAVFACGIIAARYAGETSISADGVSFDSTGVRAAYLEMQAALREQRAALVGVAPEPYAGGMDPAEDYGDLDVAPKEFGTGMTDNPAAGRQDYGSQRGNYYNNNRIWPWAG